MDSALGLQHDNVALLLVTLSASRRSKIHCYGFAIECNYDWSEIQPKQSRGGSTIYIVFKKKPTIYIVFQSRGRSTTVFLNRGASLNRYTTLKIWSVSLTNNTFGFTAYL